VNDLNTQLRVNNSIRYVSPEVSGVTVGVMYGFGGVAGDFSRNSIFSAGVSYATGPVALGAAFISARQPNVSFWGNNNGGGATANNMGSITGVQSNPIFAGYSSASRYQVIAVGGAYTLGPATLGLVYTNTGFHNLGDTSAGPNPRGYSGDAIFNDFEINLTYKITPALFAGAAYSFTNGNGPNGNDARYHQINLGMDYFLSKRTDVYIQGFYQKASGIDSTGQPAVASFFNATPSNVNHEGMLRVGMRHRF
jgi:predicted porin